MMTEEIFAHFLFFKTSCKTLLSPQRGEATHSFQSRRGTNSCWRFTTSLVLIAETRLRTRKEHQTLVTIRVWASIHTHVKVTIPKILNYGYLQKVVPAYQERIKRRCIRNSMLQAKLKKQKTSLIHISRDDTSITVTDAQSERCTRYFFGKRRCTHPRAPSLNFSGRNEPAGSSSYFGPEFAETAA